MRIQELAPLDQPIEDNEELANFDNMTDRELLEHIALNMITTQGIMSAIMENLPKALQQLDDSPTARMILRFIK